MQELVQAFIERSTDIEKQTFLIMSELAMPSKNNNNTTESLKSISENSSSGRSNCSINVDMQLFEESPVQKGSVPMSVGTTPTDGMNVTPSFTPSAIPTKD